ncbi:MAG: F0F1 ATP synthase subunit alpha [Mycoplasmatales bacterium]|nr:F0F1 ATP synthase subunit alpha [Mycoplasmatales bacterium]
MTNKIKTNLIIYKTYDTIACVQGDYDFQIYETVEFEDGNIGYVVSIEKNTASIAMLAGEAIIGETVYPSGETFHTHILAQPFGKMFDGDGSLIKDLMPSNKIASTELLEHRKSKKMYLFEEPKSIYSRERVSKPIHTGTFSLDTMIPIGRGQRELIVGDGKTGKTSIALNILLAQRNTDVLNIYVAIGKKKSEIIKIIDTLKENNVLHKTIIIASGADDYPSKKVIAPYAGMAFARYLSQQSKDVLIVLDDLSIHADAHRELSLLVGASPGREAFPGDVFFMHSKLLENAGKFNHILGNGSITAIPIVETQDGDISGYIPTNVISITDGQIYTSRSLFNKGVIPAIDIPLSVSRVGSTAQTSAMAISSSGLKTSYVDYNEQLKMTSFGLELNSAANVKSLQHGKILYELVKQDEFQILDYGVSALISSIAVAGYFDFYSDDLEVFEHIKSVLLSFMRYDVLGKKISEVFSYTHLEANKMKLELNQELINKYLVHIVLPLIKYNLTQNVPGIRRNKAFIEKFKDIRVDSRILLSHRRKKYDIGIVYDYQL